MDFAVSQFSGNIREKCFNIEVENFQIAVELTVECRGMMINIDCGFSPGWADIFLQV